MSIANEDKLKEVIGKDNHEQMVYDSYHPSEEETKIRNRIVKHFTKGYQIMYKPRIEFDDLSLIGRMDNDKKATNTYLKNNGDIAGIDSWRSTAKKPMIRNKVYQTAAAMVDKLLFPKVFAQDDSNDEQEDAAIAMRNIMEKISSTPTFDWRMFLTKMVYEALSQPTVYGFKGFQQVKRKDKHGKMVEDEYLSGHIAQVVPADQIFIPNLFETNLQLQDYLVWRQVLTKDLADSKYGNKEKYPNYKFVKGGMMAVLNDANQLIYSVYDSELQKDEVEEVLYWNRKKCEFHILINGILITDCESNNPREDGRYPFEQMIYSMISTNFIHGKSLAHAEYPTAKVIDRMWRQLHDATTLSSFPPLISRGGESITSDVIVPGNVTPLADKDSAVDTIPIAQNLKASVTAMQLLEESAEKTAPTPMPEKIAGNATAYAVAKQDQQANQVLGLFYTMVADFVVRYGRLMVSDILQYETLGKLDATSGKLGYKTFLFQDKKGQAGKQVSQKLIFDSKMPKEAIDEDKMLEISAEIMADENSDMEIMKANPTVFRKLRYDLTITADQLKIPSADYMSFKRLETYDRGVKNPVVDQRELAKDFLFKDFSDTIDADRYVPDPQSSQASQQTGQQPNPQPGQPVPGMNNQPKPSPLQPQPAQTTP